MLDRVVPGLLSSFDAASRSCLLSEKRRDTVLLVTLAAETGLGLASKSSVASTHNR